MPGEDLLFVTGIWVKSPAPRGAAEGGARGILSQIPLRIAEIPPGPAPGLALGPATARPGPGPRRPDFFTRGARSGTYHPKLDYNILGGGESPVEAIKTAEAAGLFFSGDGAMPTILGCLVAHARKAADYEVLCCLLDADASRREDRVQS